MSPRSKYWGDVSPCPIGIDAPDHNNYYWVKKQKYNTHIMELCPLGKSDLRALDFVVDRFFMKLFQTSNIEVVRLAQRVFGFVLPSFLIEKQSNTFYMIK